MEISYIKTSGMELSTEADLVYFRWRRLLSLPLLILLVLCQSGCVYLPGIGRPTHAHNQAKVEASQRLLVDFVYFEMPEREFLAQFPSDHYSIQEVPDLGTMSTTEEQAYSILFRECPVARIYFDNSNLAHIENVTTDIPWVGDVAFYPNDSSLCISPPILLHSRVASHTRALVEEFFDMLTPVGLTPREVTADPAPSSLLRRLAYAPLWRTTKITSLPGNIQRVDGPAVILYEIREGRDSETDVGLITAPPLAQFLDPAICAKKGTGPAGFLSTEDLDQEGIQESRRAFENLRCRAREQGAP